MAALRALTDQDRILILAPHPDDESLAAGGLIQVALEAGAEVRVLYATNGDNNPWPQRVRERRIRIGAECRRRWGRTRQAEAVAALSHLGVTRAASGMAFLGFPDQGFQSAVLEMDAAPLDALAREIGHFRPTLLVTPSLHDRHPDHNSLALIAGLALQRVGLPVERLVYLVHTNGRTPLHTRIELPLTSAQQRRKREAIAMHATQMFLSSRRLLRHAGPVEVFYKPVEPKAGHANHPLASAHVSGDHIHLWMPAAELPRLPSKLFISMECLADGGVRWVMPLPFRSGMVAVRDNLSGARVCDAPAEVTERGTSIRIPLALESPDRIFIKVKAPTLFFEKTGWREVSVDSVPRPAVEPEEPRVPRAAAWIGRNSRAWIALSVLALSWLCATLTEHIRRPWVNLVDFNGAVWSQAAHNILRAGLVRTEGASTGFYFGPLPIPPAGYYLHHPPLLHLALTWMFAIFGEHEWVARLLPIACSLASGVLLWLLVRSCAGTRAAAFSLAVFACLPMELRYGSMVNFEPVVLTFVLAALCCLRQWHVTGRGQWKALAAACVMTGLWIDWAMYIFALILCIYWFTRPRLKMRGMAWLLTAFMLVSGALFLLRIEVLRPDALQSLSDAFFRRIGSKPESHIHFTELQWVEKIAHILFIHFLATGWALAFAGGAIIRRKKSTGDEGVAWLGWACAAMGAMDFVFLCVFQDESYIHQYIGYYLVAPVAALGGVALDEMVAWLQARIARRSPWGFAGACVPCLALIIFCGWTGIEQRNAMRKQFLVLDYTTPEPPDLIPELGETIRENFAPGTNILCNFLPDYGPQLEYYAQRNLLNNVCEYRFWHQFLGNPKLQNPGGVIWMNTQGADEIVANLPPGDRRFVRVGDFSFCIWKPAAATNPSASVKPPHISRS